MKRATELLNKFRIEFNKDLSLSDHFETKIVVFHLCYLSDHIFKTNKLAVVKYVIVNIQCFM